MISPRKAIIAMDGYKPPTSGRSDYLRLDFNENTLGCSPCVLETMKKISELNIYPSYDELTEKLADFFKVDSGQITPANGTDEAIKTVIETFLERGEEMILPIPTYAMFKFYAQLNEAVIKEILYNPDLSFPTEKVLEAINPKTKIIVVVNPNNPTGTAILRSDLVRIIEKASKNGSLALVDEAYFPFFNETAIPLIGQYPNLVILRTFSKAFGLAGLRIGCILSNSANMRAMDKVLSPYSVNSVASACAITAMQDYDYVKNYVQQITQNKQALYSELEKLKIKYYKSDSNFVLLSLGDECNSYFGKLKQKGILVRNRTNDPLLKGCLRITIGAKEQMKTLVRALEEIKSQKLLIFDLDGVLIDVSQSYNEAIRQTAEFFTGKKINPAEVIAVKSLPGFNNDWDTAEQILLNAGVKIPKQKIISKLQEFYLGGLIKKEKLLIDKNVLSDLSNNYSIALFTGRPRAEALSALAQNEILPYFSEIIALEDVQNPKPNPEGLLKILSKFPSKSVLYFGDSIDDMRAAKSAGIRGIGILPPGNALKNPQKLLLANGAENVLEDINQIREVLE